MNSISMGVSKTKTKWNGTLIFVVMFIVAGIIGFCCFPIYKKTFLSSTDGFYQYYPLINNLRHFWKSVFSGNGISWWSEYLV